MIGNTFRKPNQKQLHNAASADRAEMLQSHVIHPEQKTGHQGQDDNDHRPFEVHRIADMTAAVGSLVRDEKERLERIERRMQPAEAAARFEIGFYPV
mgnify:CR=1 FL=1